MKRSGLILAGLLMSMTTWAAPVDELVQRLTRLKSLQGEFEQTILDQGSTRLQEARGSMTLARGNRFYWHTLEPFEQLAVSDGETLWIYDVDLEQVVEKPMGNRVANTPALLFSGDPASVAQAFEVQLLESSNKRTVYRLKPKSEDPLFETLEVTFQDQAPTSMRLEDALGQQTAIDFRNVRVNKAVAAELFDFVPPEGADVIRQGE